jgi:exonuclease SbcC
MAACLASELKPGEPCPVCGAVEHPLPAPAEKVSSGPKGETALKERTLREAEQAMAVASVERQAQDREAEGLAKRLAELAGAVVKLRPEAEHETETVALFRTIPAPGAVSSMLEKCIAVLNAAVSARDEGRRAGGRIDALYRERDVLLAQGTEQEKEAAGTEARIRALETAAEELEERRALLIRDLPAAESLESLDRRIEDLEAEIRQGREEAEQAGRLLAAAGAREESCRLRRDEGAAQRQSAETALAEALQASPFKSAEALGEAILEGETELRMEEDIRRWKEERGHAQAVLAEAERTLEQIRAKIAAAGPGISGPPAVSAEPVPAESVPADIPELRSRLLRLEEEAAAADSERDKAAAALDALEQDERRLREETKRHEELAKRHALLNALAEDLSGKNPKKTSFDAWLLGRYLAEVAAFATRRLRRMSESRYSLLLDHAGGAYRGNTGLDLAVFDAYTGKTRPCATLSGGESFMASISLALGLADSIQSRSGGVRLDAVFIDEGFGSLDEATLDKALDILDELRDHRMVGLISHVGEMKSRIPSRIEVIKTGSGSGIRIEKDG